MIELPRYVHRVTKTRRGAPATIYTFYTRHRNTPDAWPSITLPEPLSPEFAAAILICEALDREDGRFLLHGVVLPDHKKDTKAFWAKAGEIHKAKQRRDHAAAKDFIALIDDFKASPAYTELSKSTRKGYDRSAEMISASWGYDLPAALSAVDAQQAIDALGDTPATANQFRAFGSRLMSWGIPRGFCDANPFEHTEKIPGGEPWTPWPEWAFEVLFEHAPFNILMPCVSVLFTGQRQVDILAMSRPQPSDTVIEVKAQKTKSTVWIPIHSGYRPWISRARNLYEEGNRIRMAAGKPAVVSGALHLGVKGLPYATTDGFRAQMSDLINTKPFAKFRENRIVFHGLRKNAVNILLEVGATETQVGAIVNMSEQMVRHYSRDVNMKRLAQEGMKFLEANWSEVMPKALEQEQNGNWKPAERIGNRWVPSRRS